MIDVTYKAAEKADIAAIAAIHVASWRNAYQSILDPKYLAGPIEEDRLALWSDRLSNPPPTLRVETARDAHRQIVGFVAAYRDRHRQWGSQVDNLHVLPEWRGRKIGESLLRLMARRLDVEGATGGMHLWVFEANQAALRFYRKLGGMVVERDTSRIPTADGQTILRVHWPTRSALG